MKQLSRSVMMKRLVRRVRWLCGKIWGRIVCQQRVAHIADVVISVTSSNRTDYTGSAEYASTMSAVVLEMAKNRIDIE
jgi:hypothetical protein